MKDHFCMSFEHIFWGVDKHISNSCYMHRISDHESNLRIRAGLSVADTVASDCSIHCDPSEPDRTIFVNHLENIGCHVIVSERLKDFLVSQALPNVEYLRLKVYNHKDRPISQSYYIVNPINPIDCLDLDTCVVTWKTERQIRPKRMEAFETDPIKCAALPALFRAQTLSKYLLIHRDLAAAMDAEGFEGNLWVQPEHIAGETLSPDVGDHYK